ncbi:PP2C family protein-serine/threonine phosphatase, partial [uncultured Gimesia sp.]|nr:stage II sporulation protein E [Planctomycetaceae bacterium]
NAGHLEPLLRETDGTLRELSAEHPSVPLGVMDDYEYQAIQHHLQPGEQLILYTDGVTEAMNEEREQFGIERLKSLILDSRLNPAELGEQILKAVRTFAGQAEQYDDLTLVIIGRTP